MKAKIKHLQGNLGDKPYYLALEIDDIVFKMSAEDYRKNCEGQPKLRNRATKIIEDVCKIINNTPGQCEPGKGGGLVELLLQHYHATQSALSNRKSGDFGDEWDRVLQLNDDIGSSFNTEEILEALRRR